MYFRLYSYLSNDHKVKLIQVKKTDAIQRDGCQEKGAISQAQVERFNVHARPSATAVIKEITPTLLKIYAVDTIS